MKYRKPLSLLMVLFVGAAFAADGVVPSRVIPSLGLTANTDDGADVSVTRTATREKAPGESRTATRTGVVKSTAVAADTTKTNTGTVSRSATLSSRMGTETNTRKSTDINSNSAVRRAGLVLRPSVAEFGGRAIIAGTDLQTGSNISSEIRKVTNRAAKGVTKESLSEAKGILEGTAELNKSCQDQYNECMDQFCAVVDTNQKRCSCSSNLSKYNKVEWTVKSILLFYLFTFLPLTTFAVTKAEADSAYAKEQYQQAEQIEKMIKDPTSGAASYSTTSDFGLDMDLDFSSTTDIFSLDFLTTNTTTSFSNLRGTELYNAARSRCNTVLNQCKKAGATVSQVTGNYDLAIDKDCVAYENGLKKLNENLVSNVRSAERMLQKARLAVLQNKNQYGPKECIAALESCMTDDMVCGSNYIKCVDPTKKYIDENGEVVLGQRIADITQFMKNYANTKIDKSFIENAYAMSISDVNCSPSGTNGDTGGDGSCTVKYLLQKIGVGQKVTDGGLCRAVLDKCQMYTYSADEYQPYNDVIVNYIQRAMINIRAAQYKIISDYASSCMIDVAACYNQQVTQVNAWTTSASTDSIFNIMNGACRSVALTCGLALFAGEPEISPEIPLNIDGNTYHIYACPVPENGTTADKNTAIITCLSEMFYQSLLCPDNSTYTADGQTSVADQNGTKAGWVNTKCKCNSGYTVWSGYCVADCNNNATRNENGRCVCNVGYDGNGYTCTQTQQ